MTVSFKKYLSIGAIVAGVELFIMALLSFVSDISSPTLSAILDAFLMAIFTTPPIVWVLQTQHNAQEDRTFASGLFKQKEFRSAYFPLLVVSGLFVALVCFNLASEDKSQLVSHFSQDASAKLTSQDTSIGKQIDSVFTDLTFLNKWMSSFQSAEEAKKQLTGDLKFLHFLESKPYYDQFRFLNVTGQEVIRVDQKSSGPKMETEHLQNKGDRYYFKEAIKLAKGDVYISPFDLNKENGQVETPLKPMIRFAQAVFNIQGKLIGVVILNFKGQRLIDSLTFETQNFHWAFEMLDEDAFWLMADEPKKEFSFMFPEREPANFGKQYPKTWDKIRGQKEGLTQTAEGWFYHKKVNLYSPFHSQSSKLARTENRRELIILYHYPLAQVAQESGKIQFFYRVAFIVVMVFMSLILWVYSASQLARHKAQAALIEAKEAAESLTRSKSEFLANMSHEIRTPMNAVLGMTNLVLESNLDPIDREHLDIALNSGNSLLDLISDILDFSKIESGKLEIVKSNFDFYNEIIGVAQGFKAKAQEKDLEIKTHIDPVIPAFLYGDALRIRQILVNLVGNALKFTEKGHISINAEGLEELDGTYTIQFTVEDTGIGIPLEKQMRIFESFSQADNTATRGHGGTGLGLTISKTLVSLMGGDIRLVSTFGEGSIFYFSLPLTLGHEIKETENLEMPDLNGIKILLVEDNKVNQKLANFILEKAGMIVTLAENGQESLEHLAKTEIDLVLMDMQMPVMGGVEAARNIRAGRAGVLNPDVPIIALTANAFVEDQQMCFEAGMNDYVTKPLKKTLLFHMIGKALGKNNATS